MTAYATNQSLDLEGSPELMLRAWPAGLPLLALCSGRFHPQWGRYTVLSTPSGYFRVDQSGRAWSTSARGVSAPIEADSPLEALRAVLGSEAGGRSTPRRDNPGRAHSQPPYSTGWMGYFAYELGRLLEPAVAACPPTAPRGEAASARSPDAWPLIELARCDGALVYDALHERWSATGAWAARLPEEIVTALRRGAEEAGGAQVGLGNFDYTLDALRGAESSAEHLAAVRRTIEYIRAGDIFQANITRKLHTVLRGSARALFMRSLIEAPAWYSAYFELPRGRSLLSLSPELFLQVELDGRVLTRPVKGTLPAHRTPEMLLRSEKDAAELHMIIDLCRNDLGRVCELGSVRVSQTRTVETHPTVHHGVATIEGKMGSSRDLCDLLAASFPAGSITGAPKIRAMQIIEELENSPRGPYCGCIGWLDDRGAARLSVAIRTLTLTDCAVGEAGAGAYLPGVFREADAVYGVGGGIIADSDPQTEFAETEAKAAVLRRLVRSTMIDPWKSSAESHKFAEFACPRADLRL